MSGRDLEHAGSSCAATQTATLTRVGSLDWQDLAEALDDEGHAVIPGLLNNEQCTDLANVYEDEDRFRSRVVMQRHGFGQGEYQYFRYPLPPLVAALRDDCYAPLATVANRWQEALGLEDRFPDTHRAYLEQCHRGGQQRPTPLLLSYGPGDYNCLHQDLYGEHVFPLQITVLLSPPGEDFDGGEFVLTEQRPRRQSRAAVVPLGCGDAVVFPVRHRPVRGSRGFYRVTMRHGVSRVRSGLRRTLGIIFHDAS